MGNTKEIRIIAVYAVAFLLVMGIVKTAYFPDVFAPGHFLNWDAAHYHSIKNGNYTDFRLAFFPLFPMVWKILHLGVYGIVLLNALIYFSAFYFLIKSLDLNRSETVLYLSVPSAVFFFLPYSESVFFACSTLVILGIKKERIRIVLLGLLLCIVARPAFTVLLPALFLMEFLSKETLKSKLLKLLSYCLVSIVGIALVGIVQHHFTGKWFQFFEVQKGWGNYLQIPQFPLRSWGGNMITRLDGVALIFGLLSGGLLVLYIVKAKCMKSLVIPNEVILSLAYLGGITLSVVLFRGGSLFSLNRFVFAAPFIMVAVNFFLQQEFAFSNKQLGLILLLVFLYWISFGSYVHIQALLKFLAVSVYITLFAGIKSENRRIMSYSYLLFIGINLFFQVYFYVHFLMTEGEVGWIG